ncbi:MAG: D-alanyl-D-alanine carboxypeptidase [Clostridia bacterium]|nr:D-alanyl-D-alanine carboxypeptidase [Clostridia bacterium]
MKKTVVWIFIALCCLFFIQNTGVQAQIGTSAKAAVVINADTCRVIYSQNQNERLPMASTTKIMTALLLCENADLEQTITVTKQMVTVEGSSMGLLAGDTVSYHDLLYGLLLASGNDAANTVAISLCGSVSAFADKMNEKAQQLGLKDTHFVTPSGLDAEGHYTTAYDLACLAAYALQNEDFLAACSSQNATLNYGNPPYKRTIKNHNKLLGSYDGVIGVKTGFTKKSGRCLVSAARRDGKTVVAVTLNDPNDWQDHKALLDFGLSQLERKALPNPLTKNKISVVGAKVDSVKISAHIPSVSLTKNEWQNLKYDILLPQFIYAPNGNNQPIGQIKYTLDGKPLYSADIVLAENVTADNKNSSFLQRFLKNLLLMLK